MALHPLAGKPCPPELRIDVADLLVRYEKERPDPNNPRERVAFGTSGHRGSAFKRSFNEAHILAITQAVCEYRAQQEQAPGPLFVGMDTHALSAPAQRSVLEVLAANGVETLVAEEGAFTPTPVVSHAILSYNRGRTSNFADGLIITPSHNPPDDGGIKYNPPHGGPADTNVTKWIEDRANALLRADLAGVKRVPYERARKENCVHLHDFVQPYVKDLEQAIDLQAIRGAKIRLGADPLGGSNVAYWAPIAERYGLDITVTDSTVDPSFAFMTLDHDGKIRMDCSSPYAMARLVQLKDRYQLAFGNDADSDRHGIVTPTGGLMNPNHFLSVAIEYLCTHRPAWSTSAKIGKTLVSSSMIDRVVQSLGRTLSEVPVGFKYFVDGLSTGTFCFGGEESAGAAFLRRDGTAWTTDKDGILLDLLAAEMLAVTGKDPWELYQSLESRFGAAHYTRVDAPATPALKARLKKLSPSDVQVEELAGCKITAKLTKASGNNEDIGGLKVVAEDCWFAARPSGTEDVYKIYAESFRGASHLARVLEEAKSMVDAVSATGDGR